MGLPLVTKSLSLVIVGAGTFITGANTAFIFLGGGLAITVHPVGVPVIAGKRSLIAKLASSVRAGTTTAFIFL